MSTYSYAVIHRNGWGTGFGRAPTHCHTCGTALPGPSGCTTGYGSGEQQGITHHPDAPVLKAREHISRSPAVCYACCAEADKRHAQDTGKWCGYLTHAGSERDPRDWYVSNWPGSLKIKPHRVTKGHDNIGRTRLDVWFTWDGAPWHGVNIGDNQILRCHRIKVRS